MSRGPDKFFVEDSPFGARVMVRSTSLTADCPSDAEIDSNLQMLKDELDECAKEMKRLNRQRPRNAFTGSEDA